MSAIGTLLERIYIAIGADLSGLEDGLNEAGRAARDSANAIGSSFQKVGQTLSNTGRTMSLAITAPLVAFGTHAFKAASDAQELQSAFNVTFGALAKDMNEWAVATGDAMGRSTQEIQEGANAFGLYFNQAAKTREEAAKLSQSFTVLAQDLASFHNTSVDEALLALRSGLSGETEPLRRYGVFLNEAAIQAKALEMGLVPVNGKLTDQQKIMARSAIIMEKTADAQGDVMRTSTSSANELRSLGAAWDELSVSLGQILLPIITPIVRSLSDMAKQFSSLDPAVQSTIVTLAGIAAVLGPVLVVMGAVVSSVGTLITAFAPLYGAVVGLFGAGGVFAGAFSSLSAFSAMISLIGGALAPVLVPLAAVAAVGAVIWANWDKISPVLAEFGNKVQEVLGPKLVALFDTVKTTAMELWEGPFGEAIQVVIDFLGEFAAAYLSVLGEGLVRVLSAAIDVVTGAFKIIGDAIGLVIALLQGDWGKAWEYAKSIVVTLVETILNVVESLVPGATDAMKRLYDGVKQWLQDKLNAVWDWVIGKIDTVKTAFFDLYDAVVGNSYIPDMVDGIESNMARLQQVMVDPVKRATTSARDAFRDLAADTASLLDSLFPLEAQLRRIAEEMSTLDRAKAAGLLDQGTYDAARDRLTTERLDVRRQQQGEIPLAVLQGADEPLVDLSKAIEDLGQVAVQVPEMLSEAQQALYDFGDRLGNDIMGGIASVLTGRSSLKDVVKNLFARFMEDTIVSALSTLEKAAFGDQGLGGFFGTVLSSFLGGGSRAVGGPTLPGRAYDVGFGEKFVPGMHGRILSRSDAMKAVGGGSGGERRIAITISGARGNQEIMEMVREGVAQGLGQYDRVVGERVNNNYKRRS